MRLVLIEIGVKIEYHESTSAKLNIFNGNTQT